MIYKTVIGLEVHVELKTKSKMFCGCSADYFGKKPNAHTCPVCLGLPGALPVPNKTAIDWCIMIGLALNCKIANFSKFDRKNYFYPDLPKGYQISQYDQPFCQKGVIALSNGKKIGITRVHMEEDTAKLTHQGDDSLIDFNRSGVPLVEIVTEPDFETAKEVVEYLKKLQQIVRYLGVSNADMEEGNMRLEPNISLRELKTQNSKLKSELPNYKVEVKNINSFRFVEKAIEYEIKRQTEIIKTDGVIEKETRGWDEKNEKTISQRSKEFAHDYRYFPEPDIPPLRLLKIFSVDQLKPTIPELPLAKKKRMINEYNLREKDISALIEHRSIAEFIENSFSELRKKDEEKYKNNIQVAINWFLRDVLGFINDKKISFAEQKITPENLAEFVVLLSKGKISGPLAKELFLAMQETGDDPSHLILERGLEQIGDTGKLLDIIDSVISQNPKVISDFEKGKKEAKMFLVGQVMKDTKGKADPQIVGELLDERLKGF